MQIKSILLIVVIGAVAVLAKKGSSSSSSEEDRNDYDVLQVWPQHKPGKGPRPHKFKGPKHHQFYRPQYQQQFYPQGPQYPQPPHYPQRPHYPPGPHYPHPPHHPQPPQYPQPPQSPVHEPGTSPLEVQQYLENVQRQMQEFSAAAYKEFQMVENEIERNKQRLEETMKSQFQTLELAMEAKQTKEIEQAIKDGKDELKIQDCLAEEEQEFRAEMDADIQRTVDCVEDATQRAKKFVGSARNTYTESSMMNSFQAKELAQKMKYCSEMRDSRCVRETMTLIKEKTATTVEEGGLYFKKIQEAPQSQMIQMQYCRQNFMDDLRDMKEGYAKMVKRCVIASEISQPEEDEEKEAESGNLNVNIEVKPVQPEVEVNAEV